MGTWVHPTTPSPHFLPQDPRKPQHHFRPPSSYYSWESKLAENGHIIEEWISFSFVLTASHVAATYHPSCACVPPYRRARMPWHIPRVSYVHDSSERENRSSPTTSGAATTIDLSPCLRVLLLRGIRTLRPCPFTMFPRQQNPTFEVLLVIGHYAGSNSALGASI